MSGHPSVRELEAFWYPTGSGGGDEAAVYVRVVGSAARRRSAVATWKGTLAGGRGLIEVRVPMRVPLTQRRSMAERLVNRLLCHRHRRQRLESLMGQQATTEETVSFVSLETLNAYARQVNQLTINHPRFHAVRLGSARRSRLAQINLKTGQITLSRFCLPEGGVPERAFRYLILHELCHLIEPNHSAAFWDLVAHHEPQWRRYDRLIKHVFKTLVDEDAPALMFPLQ